MRARGVIGDHRHRHDHLLRLWSFGEIQIGYPAEFMAVAEAKSARCKQHDLQRHFNAWKATEYNGCPQPPEGGDPEGSSELSITSQHTQESLCVAHIYALAASAGLNYGVNYKFDYGIDGQFNLVTIRKDASTPSGNRRVSTGYPLEFQAKASYDWEIKDGHVIYDLEAKNYNDIVLRSPAETMLILILLCLPKEAKEWHNTDGDVTVLRHCCYWHSFSGEATDNTSKRRIKIPVDQRLTPGVLSGLMYKEKERRDRQATA